MTEIKPIYKTWFSETPPYSVDTPEVPLEPEPLPNEPQQPNHPFVDPDPLPIRRRGGAISGVASMSGRFFDGDWGIWGLPRGTGYFTGMAPSPATPPKPKRLDFETDGIRHRHPLTNIFSNENKTK